jgi:hypothetical protein
MEGPAPETEEGAAPEAGPAGGGEPASASRGGAAPETFLSGRPGYTGPRRAPLLRAADRLLDLGARLRGMPRALDRLAAAVPPRRVLVLCLYRPESARVGGVASELAGSRHDVRLALGSTGEARLELAEHTVAEGLKGGKFQNLNALLDAVGDGTWDWILVVDDDVALPERFLDRMVGVCERRDLALAQPAQSLASHAAWPVTRRRALPLARETRFVEIGPVTAIRRDAAAALVPFPDLRFGWGLDLHWAALGAERGWRLGVVDALPVRHEDAHPGTSYSREQAVREASAFLAGRPYLRADEAHATLAVHGYRGRR